MYVIKKYDNKKEYITNYVVSVIKKNIEYDNETNHLVVTMENSYNEPDERGCTLEEININDFFETEKEAQTEILIRERFNHD